MAILETVTVRGRLLVLLLVPLSTVATRNFIPASCPWKAALHLHISTLIIYSAGCNIRENTSLACDEVIMYRNTEDLKDPDRPFAIQAQITAA